MDKPKSGQLLIGLDPRTAEMISALGRSIQLSPEAASAIRTMQESSRQLAESVRNAFASWNVSIPIFDEGFAKTLKEAFREFPEKAELLGRFGWIIPMRMVPGTFMRIARQADRATIDSVFVDYYNAREREELIHLRKSLKSRQNLNEWKKLLQQSFSAFDRKHYQICVPALLTVIDGLCAKSWVKHFEKKKARAEFFQKQIADLGPESFSLGIWRSVWGFIDELFKDVPWDKGRPRTINRHWILHGRDAPLLWSQADVLRLLQAIETLSSLQK